jgi:cytochrome c oxidase subunit 4
VSETATHHDEDHGMAHTMSVSALLTVFSILVVLTILTVSISNYIRGHEELHNWGVPVAMAIATVKAILVVLYFMHLRYDKSLNNLIFFFCFAFVFLFMIFTLVDTLQYHTDIETFVESQPPAPAAAPAAPPAAH